MSDALRISADAAPFAFSEENDPAAASAGASPFVQRPSSIRFEDCDFYHSMDLPDRGPVVAGWDFREAPEAYLGNVPVRDRQVLDVGPASGFFSFFLERSGADVVAFEIAPDVPLDLVPYAAGERPPGTRRSLERIRSSFWYAHRALGSHVRVAHGSVYDVPGTIGSFDAALVGSVLLHLRDPFLALSSIARVVRRTLIVTEPTGILPATFVERLLRRSGEAKMIFLPEPSGARPVATWWTFTPEVVSRFLRVLGFENTTVTRHTQRRSDGRRHGFFTVVGERRDPREARIALPR